MTYLTNEEAAAYLGIRPLRIQHKAWETGTPHIIEKGLRKYHIDDLDKIADTIRFPKEETYKIEYL